MQRSRRLRRAIAAAASLALGASLVAVAPSVPTHADPPMATIVASCDGLVHDLVFMPSITLVHVHAVGASGSAASGHAGGRGAVVDTDVVLPPGAALRVRVGCSNGFNGGGTTGALDNSGNGGGATDVRLGGDSLADRIVVAAGGGGGGVFGDGGSATGQSGGDGVVTGAGDVSGGKGATPTAGGAHGGALGSGGSGDNGGGGGGGGLYGGGGSGQLLFCDLCHDPINLPGGGGGAGSSAGPAGATFATAAGTGDGALIITMDPDQVPATATTTTIIPDPAFQPPGQVPLTVHVGQTANPGAPGVGSVTLTDAAGNTATRTLDANGNVSFVTGPYSMAPSFSAQFTPATGFLASSTTLTMQPFATSTHVDLTPPSGEIGQPVHATATVTYAASGAPVRTGSVLFADGAATATVSLTAAGTAEADLATPLAPGTYDVDATYSSGSAGLAGSAGSAVYTVGDSIAPVVTVDWPSASGLAGWYTAPVVAVVTATDNDVIATLSCTGASLTGVSGLGSSTATATATVVNDGVTTVECTTGDASGNSASRHDVLRIDTTPPGLAWSGGPADGASYVFGSVPGAPSCAAGDGGSGPASCSVAGYSTSVGTHVLTATASDIAGNVTTATRSYTVTAWSFSGLFAPVDMGGVVNTVKGGSTVPMKFRVFAGAVEQTSTAAISSLRAAVVPCNASAPQDPIEVTSAGESALRYDGTQFIDNWKTPRSPGSCIRFTVVAVDGSSISALFQLK